MIDYINKNIQKDNSSPEVKAEYMREVDAMMAQNAQIKQQNKQIVDKYSQTFAHNRNPEEEMEQ